MFEAMGKPIEFLSSNSDYMWTIIYIFAIWTGLGANVIMISGAMLRIPGDIAEYCQLEGVGFWRELFQIVIPLIMPTLGVYMINILLSVFAFTMQPMMITFNNAGEAGKYYTVGWYIFDAAQQNAVGSSIYASTLGLLLTVIMTPFIITARVLVKKFTPDVQF
jgi:ABC-type sugar transport system permease subunit